MKFGACLKLSDLTANQVGPGTWNAEAGTYTTTLAARGACGGSSSDITSTLILTAHACGVLKFTASATGYLYSTASAALVVYGGHFADTAVTLLSPGGGDAGDACPTGPMTGDGSGTLAVDCGDAVVIQFTRSFPSSIGAITATVVVEVDEG